MAGPGMVERIIARAVRPPSRCTLVQIVPNSTKTCQHCNKCLQAFNGAVSRGRADAQTRLLLTLKQASSEQVSILGLRIGFPDGMRQLMQVA